jgi:hypothetical protein
VVCVTVIMVSDPRITYPIGLLATSSVTTRR